MSWSTSGMLYVYSTTSPYAVVSTLAGFSNPTYMSAVPGTTASTTVLVADQGQCRGHLWHRCCLLASFPLLP